MTSRTTASFREALAKLPPRIQKLTREAYVRWREDPAHPGLQFKKANTEAEIYSARIGEQYRALAFVDDERVVWFWIGPHAEYDTLLPKL